MNSIRTVLALVRDQLNTFLQSVDRRPDDWVILANMMDRDGSAFEAANDRIVMSLANIAEETITAAASPVAKPGSSPSPLVQRPLYADLFVLFYASFQGRNYLEGLTAISRTVGFFQQNPVFTRTNLPHLDAGIDSLRMEFVNLDLAALNQLMGMMGMNYLPSVYYKLRVVPAANATAP